MRMVFPRERQLREGRKGKSEGREDQCNGRDQNRTWTLSVFSDFQIGAADEEPLQRSATISQKSRLWSNPNTGITLVVCNRLLVQVQEQARHHLFVRKLSFRFTKTGVQ